MELVEGSLDEESQAAISFLGPTDTMVKHFEAILG